MTNVNDANLVVDDAVENKVVQSRHGKQERVGFVCLASLVRVVFERPRKLDEPRHDTRRSLRTVLADVRVDSEKVLLR